MKNILIFHVLLSFKTYKFVVSKKHSLCCFHFFVFLSNFLFLELLTISIKYEISSEYTYRKNIVKPSENIELIIIMQNSLVFRTY